MHRVLVDGPVSKHVQLRRILQEEIRESGAVDDALPSERQLMQAYNVGRSTVREAVEQLIKCGLAYRVAGKGTYIKATEPDERTSSALEPRDLDTRRRLGMLSFTNELVSRGLEPSTKVVRADQFINPAIADLLGADPVAPVVMYSRLRLGDGRPMAVQTSYLKAETVGEDGIALLKKGPSLYEVLAARGVTPVRAREKYRCATLANSESCALLGLGPGSPVFAVERVTFDGDGTQFEYATSVLRPDMYTLEIEIN
jgi:GntR family transcriptional regulator